MVPIVFDLETSIEPGPHGPSAKNPENDFYTLIWGERENIRVVHKEQGFNRNLDVDGLFITSADLIVGHNLPFDLSYIVKYITLKCPAVQWGWIPEVWDTQIAEYLMSGQRHSYSSLVELQKVYLGKKEKIDRISQLYKKGIGADKIIKARDRCKRLFKLYDEYCYLDGRTTLDVYYEQYKRASALGMLPIIKLYNAYMVALVLCMNTGVKVDIPATEKMLREFRLRGMSLLEQASNIVNKYWTNPKLPKFNILSPAHKSAVLFGGEINCEWVEDNGFFKNGKPKTKKVKGKILVEGMGLPKELTSESKVEGRYSTGEDAVHNIYNKSNNDEAIEYCRLQKESMNLEKMCSTYLEAFLHKSINGNIYPNFNNTATTTSRLSSSQPNFQNIPSKGEMGHDIQALLIAPDDYKCVSIDFSQLEIYVLAWLSGDSALTNDLLSGVDFHIKRLAYAEDMSYDEVFDLCKIQKLPEWDLKRSKAKTISYQKAYGAAPKSLAKTTGIPEEVIKIIFEKEDMEYTGVAQFNNDVMAEVNRVKELSYAMNLPKAKKHPGVNGKKFLGKVELLPIILQDGKIHYDQYEFRNIGYYRTPTGKRYAFEEYGKYDRNGYLQRSFSPTQTKNYQIQGTAGDIMAVVTAELMPYLVKYSDSIKMVNQVHDSIWFYIKKDKLSVVVKKIVVIMEDIPKAMKKWLNIEIPFKFKVDVKIGNNFGEMESYNGE